MNDSKQETVKLTVTELTVLNLLKSLDKGERLTFQRISNLTGFSMRKCQKSVEDLRLKGYRVISSKSRFDLGTCLISDEDENEWQSYLKTRSNEAQTIFNSIHKMKTKGWLQNDNNFI